MKSKTSIVELFSDAKINQKYLKVCAPMVRYSKVHFRTLVKNYGVNLCFTPMILADSFCQNEKARASEFATTISDTPLIVQFAANNAADFVDATTLLYPYVDGVDLNCGCPQRWAMKDGYGCALLSKPETIKELVRGVRSNFPNTFSISVKVRILKDLKKSIELCKQLEMCGVDFLTVHGRTPAQKSSGDVDKDALKKICQSLQIPVIANGGIKTLSDADDMYDVTHCNGVMAASAILNNPALFSGANRTPLDCIKMWIHLKDTCRDQITFQCYHHHLVFMLDKTLTKQQKQDFNVLSTFEDVDEYLCKYVLNNETDVNFMYALDEFVTCEFSDEITMRHSGKCRGCGKSLYYCICVKYDSNNSDGNFFTSYLKKSNSLENIDSYLYGNLFDEPT
ncbi:hypothetical protein O0L34_g16342 [Tuta absoluta]|nr:hypothetical protein O0L34_g16342 [Tuta absoluta]